MSLCELEKMEPQKGKTIARLKAQGEEKDDEQEEEEVRHEFQCCICLDLIYKPVVLGCGHLSCFWCIFNAMNIWHESHCPICRYPYNHFPSVCQLLHFLLLKMYPIAYKRRERQVGEEEKKEGNFSPTFDDKLPRSLGSHLCEQSISQPILCILLFVCTITVSKYFFASFRKQDSLSSSNLLQAAVHSENDIAIVPSILSKDSEENINAASETCGLSQKNVTVTDLLCIKCKKLLFQPVVLNCGHVHCESCIIIPVEEITRCQVCQSLHPCGFSNVCKALVHFLEEQFAEEYAKRREEKQICSTKAQQPAVSSSLVPPGVHSTWLLGNGPKIHVGVGCDYCGMTPITGERYKCKDCVEIMGFDLCEMCYNNPSKSSGRFNQQHKPEHIFEVMQPQSIRDLIIRFNSEISDGDGSDSSEDHGSAHLHAVSSNDIPQDVGNALEGIDDNLSCDEDNLDIPQDVGNALEGIDDNLLCDEEDNLDAHNSPHLIEKVGKS